MRIRVVGAPSIMIAAADKAAAMKAVKTACRGFWRSFDGADPIEAAASLTETMAQMGWFLDEDADGNIVGVYFEKKPYCDDEVASAIAPFVREGSTIEVVDSDDHHWRWKFTAGGVVRQEGRVVYDE